jgi:hypothetical protein
VSLHVLKSSADHKRRVLAVSDAASSGDYWSGLSGVWAAYEPKGAASLAASYTDKSGNNNDAGVGVAPAWDATNGWKFNGSTQYLTTTFLAAADQSQAILVQYTNLVSANYDYLAGAWTAATGAVFGLGNGQTGTMIYRNGNFVEVASRLAAGNLAISGTRGYRNGIAEGAAIASIGALSHTCYIGALHANGSPGNFASVYIQALVICSATNTAQQIRTAAIAMAAL